MNATDFLWLIALAIVTQIALRVVRCGLDFSKPRVPHRANPNHIKALEHEIYGDEQAAIWHKDHYPCQRCDLHALKTAPRPYSPLKIERPIPPDVPIDAHTEEIHSIESGLVSVVYTWYDTRTGKQHRYVQPRALPIGTYLGVK